MHLSSPHTRRQHLLKEATKLFHRNTGLTLDIETIDPLIAINRRADALVRLELGNLEIPFVVELRTTLHTKEQLEPILNNPPINFGHRIIIAEFISPQVSELLKHSKIAHLDLTGKIFLPLEVDIKGKPIPSEQTRKKETYPHRPTSFQTDSMTHLVFLLLADTEAIQYTQQKLATLSGLSLGAVNKALNSLIEYGFISQKGSSRLLHRKKELLDRWIIAYSDRLKGRLFKGRFRSVHPDQNWQHFPLNALHAYWGSESAAAILTQHLKPGIHTIYTRENEIPLLNTLRLIRDDQGNIEVFKAFWPPEVDDKNAPVTPDILIYADLMATGIDRNVEIAKEILEKIWKP